MTGALSPEEIGERLRVAREAAKVTQAAAASALEVARTTVVAIEQGQRRAKLDELQRLASLYGVSLNALLRREAVQVDLKPRFRRMGEQDDGVEGARQSSEEDVVGASHRPILTPGPTRAASDTRRARQKRAE